MVLLAPLACMPLLPIHGSKRNEVDRVQTLIQEGADIEPKHFGWSPLMRASKENHTDIIQLLLSKRAKNRKGRTQLSFAVSPSKGREVSTGTLLLFLQAGADPSQKDTLGMTAKARATREKRKEALEILNNWERPAQCIIRKD